MVLMAWAKEDWLLGRPSVAALLPDSTLFLLPRTFASIHSHECCANSHNTYTYKIDQLGKPGHDLVIEVIDDYTLMMPRKFS